jgi:preprotein translocase subunit SecD
MTASTPSMPSQSPATPETRRHARLEVVRVDDTIDAFKGLRDADDIEIHPEHASVGPGKVAETSFARMAFREGEREEEAVKRFRRWLAKVPLPKTARFGLETVNDASDDAQSSAPTGLRTFVLVGDSVLLPDDVVDAIASVSNDGGFPTAYVSVELSAAGGTRFEEAARAWLSRRMAILVDDRVESAPIIRSPLAGGRFSITMGAGDADKHLAEARRLALALRR